MKDWLEMIFYCITIIGAVVALCRWVNNKIQRAAQQEQNLSSEQIIQNDLNILNKREYFSKTRKDHFIRYIFLGIWIQHLYFIGMRTLICRYKKGSDIK
jgi:hypothetical protein